MNITSVDEYLDRYTFGVVVPEGANIQSLCIFEFTRDINSKPVRTTRANNTLMKHFKGEADNEAQSRAWLRALAASNDFMRWCIWRGIHEHIFHE